MNRQSPQPRYVDIRFPVRNLRPEIECRYCGRAHPNARDVHGPVCSVAVCLLCGSPQCFGNGGSNGQCGICYAGLLPGWSGSDGTCTYKRCEAPAVARGRGRKKVCKDHARHQGLGTPDLTHKRLVE